IRTGYTANVARGRVAPTKSRINSIIAQQPLDIFELELRSESLAEAAAQLLENSPRTLHVDVARHLYRGVVAIVSSAQRASQRVGLVLGACRPKPAGLAIGAGADHALLLHRLRQILRAAAEGLERTALGIDSGIRIALSEFALGVAHGFAGTPELIHLALALLTLSKTTFAQFLHQFLELVAQRLLVVPQLSHLIALLALLPLLSALPALAVTPLILAVLEGPIAQLLLLADHVTQLVQRRHHVVITVPIHLLPWTGHLEVRRVPAPGAALLPPRAAPA